MLTKFIEGKNVSWVVTMNKQVDGYPLYMDATTIIKDAIEKDEKNGYPEEGRYYNNGPFYGIEVQRIVDYIEYVSNYLTHDNFHKFDTTNYRFFVGSVPSRKSKGE